MQSGEKPSKSKRVSIASNGSSSTSSKMASSNAKKHSIAYALINLWIFATIPLVIWDDGYIFLRPRSLPGGDLRWIWSIFGLMEPVDHLYGVRALDPSDGFLSSIGLVNSIEVVLNCIYIWKAYLVKEPQRSAPLYAFASASMCLAKMTILISSQYFCGWCELKHNDFLPLLACWIFPKTQFVMFPLIVIWRLGQDMVEMNA